MDTASHATTKDEPETTSQESQQQEKKNEGIDF